LTAQAGLVDRTVLRQAVSLAAHPQRPPIPGGAGDRLAEAWRVRRAAATAYADLLRTIAGFPTPQTVLVSLLHLHCVRAAGLDPVAEARAHQVARAVALAARSREPQPAGGAP